MEQVARGWLVLGLTHSPFQLGLMAFIRGSCSLVFSPLAGVMADRVDRRLLAGSAQMLAATAALAVGLLVATDRVALWHLYLAVGAGGIAQATFIPTRQVLVYDVVGPEYLTNAIGLNAVTANLARIAAPSVAGLLISSAGIEETYYAQVAFLLLATTALLLLRPMTRAEPVRTPFLRGLGEGFAYLRQDATVRRLVLLNFVPNVLIYPYVAMIPIFAEDVLHVGSTGYGVLLTGVGFGSIPGGLIVASMSGARRKGLVMSIAALLYMSMVALFALSSWFPLSFALLVVGGLGWSMMVSLNQTLLQLNLPDAFRGRGISFYTMANGLTPVGSLTMGTSADYLGVQRTVLGFALAGLALAAALGIASPRVRRL